MIGGLGVDIVEIDRMALALSRTPRMKERVFSEGEREYCDARSRPEVHYAMRFAAKEAMLKALGTGFSGVRFTDVEVARDERGRPVPVLHGRAAELAQAAGVREMHLSLSYTATTAVASAVVISGEPKPAEVAEPTPQEQVAAMFKASRTLLDDIEVSPREEDAFDAEAEVAEAEAEAGGARDGGVSGGPPPASGPFDAPVTEQATDDGESSSS